MPNTVLIDFVKASLGAGASRAQTRAALQQAGWAEDEIDGALNAFADIGFVVPVPVPRTQLSARDAFLYLVMFGMLYVSAYNLGGLLFDFINIALPDAVDVANPYAVGTSIRWSVASLMVAFPIFLFTATRIARRVRVDPVHRNSAIRKWLTYLTLTASAFILVGDLIVSLYNLLSGELTLRFVLKAATVAGIAASLFWYYLQTMREDDEALRK